MDPSKVLETTCELFLASEILLAEDVCNHIKAYIRNEQYEKIAKFFIYRLILEINDSTIYNEIRKKEIASYVFMLISIDEYGFKDPLIIEEYINLIIRIIRYASEYKLDLKTNKEKQETIKAKLAELSMLIQE